MADEIPPRDLDDWMARAVELIPWLRHLPKDAIEEFFTDVTTSVQHSLDLDVGSERTAERLVTELAAWKATAEVHADPELYKRLTAPGFDEKDFTEVLRPTREPMEPVRQPAPKPVVRCGASRPHEDGDEDWYYCKRSWGHEGSHDSSGRQGERVQWTDGDSFEVMTVDTVYAVASHRHDYVGDSDQCQRDGRCPLTWQGSHTWEREWKELQERVQQEILQTFGLQGMKIRSPRPLCPSNIPCTVTPDTAYWCALSAGHTGDHRDRENKHAWTDEDAQRPKPWTGPSADLVIVDEIQDFRGSDEDV